MVDPAGIVRADGPKGIDAPWRRTSPIVWLVLRRLAVGVALAWVVSVLVFAGTQLLPGDAATAILGRTATPEQVAQIRAELHLNESAPKQYWAWASGFLQGDLGRSFAAQEPVADFIRNRIANTAILAVFALMVILPLSIALGTLAGIRRDRVVDHVVSGLSLAVIALPEFVTGTILAVVFAVSLRWLPAVSLVPPASSPLSTPSVLVLPVLTLTLAALAFSIRMVRAGVVEVMQSEYVAMARLNGIAEGRLVRRHALRNALAPTVQVLALTLQWLIGGIVVVESVFQYPGIGQGLAQAVTARDIPVVQAIAMLIAIVYIAINVLADLIVVLLIPRLRTAQ